MSRGFHTHAKTSRLRKIFTDRINVCPTQASKPLHGYVFNRIAQNFSISQAKSIKEWNRVN